MLVILLVLEKLVIVVDAITAPAEKALNKLSTTTFKFFKVLDRLQKVSLKTQMQFLGVMFAGMALSRAMMNLLSPAMDAVGVFDVFNELLTLFFLPVALLLLDVVLWLFDVFSSLPQPIQDIINGLVLFGLVIGGLLSFIGQLGVGLVSIAQIFGGALLTGVSAVVNVLVGLGAVVLTLAAVIFLPLLVNWEATWKAISSFVGNIFEGIKKIIGGALEIILGIITLILDAVTRKWDKLGKDIGIIINGIVKVFEGIFVNIIGGTIKFLADLLVSWIDGVLKIVDWLKTTFIDVGNKLAGWLGITEVWNSFKSAAKIAISAVTGFFDPLINVIKTLINWINSAIDKLKTLKNLSDIPGNIVKETGNIINKVGAIPGNIVKGIGNFLGFQHGGIMPYTGLAHLEAGERVLTKSESQSYNISNAPTIIINANVSNEHDVRMLADELDRRWYGSINRSVMR
jgi:phage-related protein